MLPSFCTETVSVVRAPLVSVRGTEERDWSASEAHEVAGCSVQFDSTATDRSDARASVSDAATLYAPPGADVAEGDRIRCDLGTFEVNGTPMPRRSPTGAVSHVECQLTRWKG